MKWWTRLKLWITDPYAGSIDKANREIDYLCQCVAQRVDPYPLARVDRKREGQ